MILTLEYKKLVVYDVSRKLVTECYVITSNLPPSERFNLVQQINRAALSVILNLVEGASRKSRLERKRFYEISRGSIIEIDAALQIAVDLGYITDEHVVNLKPIMSSSFSIISKMIRTLSLPEK